MARQVIWRARKIYTTIVRSALTSPSCLLCTKSTVLKLAQDEIHETISMSAMSVLALPVARTTGSL